MCDDVETALKVVIVGNGAVGKSSLIQRYCKGIFVRDYKKTIGVDFLERIIDLDGEDVRLMLWDTAGQEEFDAITKAYYRGSHCCVIAFSTTDQDSFKACELWKKKVEAEVGEIPMVLVQNKVDLMREALVSISEGKQLAHRLQIPYFDISVKNNLRVSDVFEDLAWRCLLRLRSYNEALLSTSFTHNDTPHDELQQVGVGSVSGIHVLPYSSSPKSKVWNLSKCLLV